MRDARYKYTRNLNPDGRPTNVDAFGRNHKEMSTGAWAEWKAKARTDADASRLLGRVMNRPAEELYDLAQDPWELTNLASDPSHAEAKARLRRDYEEGAKTILWAANPHIGATPLSGCMGDHLRRTFGNDRMVIGLTGNRKDQEMGALPGSFEAVLTQAGLEIAVIDLRSLPNGAVSRYFNAARKGRNGVSYVFPWTYDAVLFIESTTNARLVRPKVSRGEVTARILQNSTLDEARLTDSASQQVATRFKSRK